MCPNGEDYEDGRETQRLRTIIYCGNNASIAKKIIQHSQVCPPVISGLVYATKGRLSVKNYIEK